MLRSREDTKHGIVDLRLRHLAALIVVKHLRISMAFRLAMLQWLEPHQNIALKTEMGSIMVCQLVCRGTLNASAAFSFGRKRSKSSGIM